MKNTRLGLGKGMGCGYKNLVPFDKHVHSMSAKGMKTYRVYISGYVFAKANSPDQANEKAQKYVNTKTKATITSTMSENQAMDKKQAELYKKYNLVLDAKGKLTKKELMKQREKLVKKLRNLRNLAEETELYGFAHKDEEEELEWDLDSYEFDIEELEDKLEKNSEQLRKVKK